MDSSRQARPPEEHINFSDSPTPMAMEAGHGLPRAHRHRGGGKPSTGILRSRPMAGRRILHSPWGLTLAALVVAGLSTASEVHGQVAAPSVGMPAADLAPIADAMAPAASMPWPGYGAPPAYDPTNGPPPPGVRVEMGLFATMAESLFGDAYAEGAWRPLSLSTFFTEGWFEPW